MNKGDGEMHIRGGGTQKYKKFKFRYGKKKTSTHSNMYIDFSKVGGW